MRSSANAFVALGSPEAPFSSGQTFMLVFDSLPHHLAAFDALCSDLLSSTYSKQQNLSPLEQDIFFGQTPEPTWRHFNAAPPAPAPGNTLRGQQGPELLSML